MEKKADYCPLCNTMLRPTKTLRMVCPGPQCTFKDRRYGMGMALPEADRRVSATYTEVVDPWMNVRR